jgi:hypothetical protein
MRTAGPGSNARVLVPRPQAIPHLEALAVVLPEVVKQRDRLSESLLSLGRLQRDAGATPRAQATNRKARAVAAVAVAARPGAPRSVARLAVIDADYAASPSRPGASGHIPNVSTRERP